jgi:glutathionylspermidine synthase
LKTVGVHINNIGSDGQNFFDEEQSQIRSIYKLYPWEWLIAEESGQQLLATYDQVQWIEPIWKMILSNKGILAVLWELFPNNDYLLPASLNAPITAEWCKKPLLSREGANVTLSKLGNAPISTAGDYGEEGFVYQGIAPVPNFDGQFPIIGSWYVLDQGAGGMGIRESAGPITNNLSRFIPHLFE